MIRALNRSVKLYIPPEATYSLIQPYIREASKLAWECSSLAHPLDVALATDAELFDEHKYVIINNCNKSFSVFMIVSWFLHISYMIIEKKSGSVRLAFNKWGCYHHTLLWSWLHWCVLLYSCFLHMYVLLWSWYVYCYSGTVVAMTVSTRLHW